MLRKDLRSSTQSRPLSVELGLATEADGSAQVIMGNTRVVASVTGPTQPRYGRHELYDRACIEVDIDISAKTTHDGTEVMQQKRKCEKFIKDSLQNCIMVEKFPRMLILLNVLVVSNDGSMLSVALNACVLAVLDAGLPMYCVPNAVSLCSFGSSSARADNESNEIVLDPTAEEECNAEANFTFTLSSSASTNSASQNSNSSITSNEKGIAVTDISGRFTSADLRSAAEVALQTSAAITTTMRKFMESKLAPAT